MPTGPAPRAQAASAAARVDEWEHDEEGWDESGEAWASSDPSWTQPGKGWDSRPARPPEPPRPKGKSQSKGKAKGRGKKGDRANYAAERSGWSGNRDEGRTHGQRWDSWHEDWHGTR